MAGPDCDTRMKLDTKRLSLDKLIPISRPIRVNPNVRVSQGDSLSIYRQIIDMRQLAGLDSAPLNELIFPNEEIVIETRIKDSGETRCGRRQIELIRRCHAHANDDLIVLDGNRRAAGDVQGCRLCVERQLAKDSWHVATLSLVC